MLFSTESRLQLDLSQCKVYITTTPLELYWDDSTFYDFGSFAANDFLLRVYMRISDHTVFVFPSRIKTPGYRNRYLETELVGPIVRSWLANWPPEDEGRLAALFVPSAE